MLMRRQQVTVLIKYSRFLGFLNTRLGFLYAGTSSA